MLVIGARLITVNIVSSDNFISAHMLPWVPGRWFTSLPVRFPELPPLNSCEGGHLTELTSHRKSDITAEKVSVSINEYLTATESITGVIYPTT